MTVEYNEHHHKANGNQYMVLKIGEETKRLKYFPQFFDMHYAKEQLRAHFSL